MNLAAAFTPVASDIPPLFQHQQQTVEFHRGHPCVMNHSSPGTGKCRSYLEALREHRDSGGGAALVLAPKTILQSAWAADAERFTPELKVSIATAENRRDGLKPGADLYLSTTTPCAPSRRIRRCSRRGSTASVWTRARLQAAMTASARARP
jgi:hypothetical protein